MTLIAKTSIKDSVTPVGGPKSCMMRCHAFTCQTTTRPAGTRASASLEADQKRRGNTAKNANSNGPMATLVANGIHRSAAGTAGSDCQKAARRQGNATETVATDASNTAPRRAEGGEHRLNAT